MPRHAKDPSSFTMSFGDHLEELRRRILFALAAPLPLFIVIFLFSDTLVEWLLLPAYSVLRQHGLPTDLQVLSPPEFLLTKLKLSLITALVITAPWLIWQLWLFIAPGLYAHERRFVYFLLPGSAILTFAGVALLYWVMLPLMLHVLVMFAANVQIEAGEAPLDPRVEAILDHAGPVTVRSMPPEAPEAGELWFLVPDLELQAAVLDGETGSIETVVVPRVTDGHIEQSFRVSSVINFTLVLMLGIVVAFQMPLVIVLLGWVGLVTTDGLRSKRRYALVICAVAAALITPADAVSMILMLVPLYGLYELGILLLVIAPASQVAEGRVLRGARPDARSGDADNRNPDKPSGQPGEAAQPGPPRGSQGPAAESEGEETEEGDGR